MSTVLQGLCPQIMGIRPTLLALPKNHTLSNGVRLRYPPTFFVYMARDVAMADWIELDADKLKSQASSPSPVSGACAVCCGVFAWTQSPQLSCSVPAASAMHQLTADRCSCRASL